MSHSNRKLIKGGRQDGVMNLTVILYSHIVLSAQLLWLAGSDSISTHLLNPHSHRGSSHFENVACPLDTAAWSRRETYIGHSFRTPLWNPVGKTPAVREQNEVNTERSKDQKCCGHIWGPDSCWFLGPDTAHLKVLRDSQVSFTINSFLFKLNQVGFWLLWWKQSYLMLRY